MGGWHLRPSFLPRWLMSLQQRHLPWIAFNMLYYFLQKIQKCGQQPWIYAECQEFTVNLNIFHGFPQIPPSWPPPRAGQPTGQPSSQPASQQAQRTTICGHQDSSRNGAYRFYGKSWKNWCFLGSKVVCRSIFIENL